MVDVKILISFVAFWNDFFTNSDAIKELGFEINFSNSKICGFFLISDVSVDKLELSCSNG